MMRHGHASASGKQKPDESPHSASTVGDGPAAWVEALSERRGSTRVEAYQQLSQWLRQGFQAAAVFGYTETIVDRVRKSLSPKDRLRGFTGGAILPNSLPSGAKATP